MRRPFHVLTLVSTLATALAAGSAPADDVLNTLVDHGQLRRAATLAESRIKARGDDAEALRVLAKIRAEERRFDDATKLAERALAVAPNDPDAHYAMAEVAGLRARASSVLKQPGLAGRFKKEAEKALAIDPRHQDAIEGMIAFHRQAPGIMGGDKKKAAVYLDRLMGMDPTAAWLVKSDMALDDKDSVTAETCLRKAVAVNGAARAKISLANWLVQPWRKPDEAERLAREAVEAEPWRVGGWALLAARQAYQRNWAEMDATLARAEAALPGNFGPHYQVAKVMIAEKLEPARAETLLRRYLTVEPEIGAPTFAGAHWRLGQALELQGKRAEAIAELQAASRLDPKLDGPKKDLKRLRG